MSPSDDPDEHPVMSRAPHTPLLPAAQSPRAPWLRTATVTTAKFKQPSVFHREEILQQLTCHQVNSHISTDAVHDAFVALQTVQAFQLVVSICASCCVIAQQAEPLTSGRTTERATPLTQRLALQQRVDRQPVAVHQQIKRETQAQVFLCDISA